MVRTLGFAGLLGGLLTLLPGSVQTGHGQAPGRTPSEESSHPPPDCLKVTSQARYEGYGYTHLVVLQSRCKKPLTCRVTTDVNPQPTAVAIPPGKKREVVTFRGSPARVFKAVVRCNDIGQAGPKPEQNE